MNKRALYIGAAVLAVAGVAYVLLRPPTPPAAQPKPKTDPLQQLAAAGVSAAENAASSASSSGGSFVDKVEAGASGFVSTVKDDASQAWNTVTSWWP